ncbi:uncharacterized protein LOC135159993 isoform X2 [Diachasmimorpha longicaudata]|uniref:uncharacterized protein LOC135159993 isoform X2 n=1 Tax=Diachasmimorpha longicaudata TaxID=58733 RepID=UPI0030B878E5
MEGIVVCRKINKTDPRFSFILREHTKEHCVDKHDEVEVSEGFKNFMAKKLAEHLDRNIEIMKEVTCSNKIRKRKHVDHPEPEDGIKLLRASGTIVKVVDDPTTSNVYTCRPSHRRILPDQNVKADSVKLKEAAVDPQYLFDGADTDFWISRRKSTVYEYKKLPDGTLVEK